MAKEQGAYSAEFWAARLTQLEVQIGQAADDGDWIRFAELAAALDALELYIDSRSGGKKGGK